VKVKEVKDSRGGYGDSNLLKPTSANGASERDSKKLERGRRLEDEI